MTKQEIYQFLDDQNITYEVTEHRAMFHMGDAPDVPLPYPEADAKNLFLRDDKRSHYYLITVRGDKRVNLKAFRREHGTRPLSFASADDLLDLLGLIPGSVTPFGLLHDRDHRVTFYLDEAFLAEPGLVGCHPCDNTATVWIGTEDLIRVLAEQGTQTHPITIS